MDWDGFLKIGHRGCAGREVENTLVSFRQAVERGAKMIEFDVRQTKDDEIVVFHDATLQRLTGRPEKIRDLTYEELRHIQIGPGQIVPKLAQVLEVFGGETLFNIELKETGIGDQVLEIVRQYKLGDSAIVSAFAKDENDVGDSSTWQDLFWMKTKEPKLKIALLANSYQWMINAVLAAGDGDDSSRDNPFPIYALCLNSDLVGEETLRAIRERTGCRVLVYTVNDPEMIKWYRQLGVDGIFSDFPDRF